MKKFINILILAIILIGCQKKSETISLKGKVFDPNQNTYIKGARVTLQATLISSGVYSSAYQDISSGLTDASGNFSFDINVQHVVSYKIIIQKDSYFYYEKIINPDAWTPGQTYSLSYNIYPEAYIKLDIKNVNPFDNNDVIYYAFATGYSDCTECCSNKYFSGTGIQFNTIFKCKTFGAVNADLIWHFTKNNIDTQYDSIIYCKPFDTTCIKIRY